MKQRVISAIFIVAITAAACLIGGYFLMAVCAFINIWGSKEVIGLKKDYKSKSLFITMCLSTLLICFMPYGVESDQYTILGEILECEKVKNYITQESIYKMKLTCNELVFDLCINEKDLYGEPEIGRRFKGNVWLQGYINYPN